MTQSSILLCVAVAWGSALSALAPTHAAARNVHALGTMRVKVWVSISLAFAVVVLASRFSQADKYAAIPYKAAKALEGVRQVAFSPDGRLMLSLSEDYHNRMRLWDWQTNKVLRQISIPSMRVDTFCFLKDSKTVAIIGERHDESGGYTKPNTVLLQDVRTDKVQGELRAKEPPYFEEIALSSDGKTAATVLSASMPWRVVEGQGVIGSGKVQLWSVSNRKLLRTLLVNTGSIYAVALSSDAKIVAASSGDSKVRLWDVQSGKLLRVIQSQGTVKFVEKIAFSPDGKRLADSSGHVWEVQTGRKLRSLPPANDWRSEFTPSLAFSPDGKILACGGSQVRLWDTRTGKLKSSLAADGDKYSEISVIGFSADCRTIATRSTLATRSENNPIRLWRIK